MRPAAVQLARALAEVRIRVPELPFASNVTGELSSDPGEIRRQLADQVCASVLWEKSMRLALARGITRFLEPAPGEVLAGILRKIDERVTVHAVARPEQVPA
jgi:[acyl-carrier-protein] S-malonyltransferase